MRPSSIALARHGPLALSDERWTSPHDLPAWIDRYESAGVLASEPPTEIKERAAFSKLLCSTAKRCIESAQRVAPGREILPHSVYCEAGLPHNLWTFPKLPPALWALLFRIAWFHGFSAHAESLAQANSRAHLAAQQLIAAAGSGGPVLLMGHGIANVLIANQLQVLGCRGPKRPSSRHWGFSVYQLP